MIAKIFLFLRKSSVSNMPKARKKIGWKSAKPTGPKPAAKKAKKVLVKKPKKFAKKTKAKITKSDSCDTIIKELSATSLNSNSNAKAKKSARKSKVKSAAPAEFAKKKVPANQKVSKCSPGCRRVIQIDSDQKYS